MPETTSQATISKADEHLLLPNLSPRFLANMIANSVNNGYSLPPWGSRFGGFGRGNRHDIDAECGYYDESEMDTNWFKRAYTRWSIAARYVNIWPDECWIAYPGITSSDGRGTTEFEDGIVELDRKTLLFTFCHRADRLSRVGQFGIIFMGFDDGGRLDRPPEGIDGDTGEPMEGVTPKLGLNYLRTFDQTVVRIHSTEKSVYNPRFGKPKYYTIQFAASASTGPGGGAPVPSPTFITNKVHWTRVIHLADNCQTSVVLGTPALLPVANLLHDMRKVVGGSAEMFWRGGFPGYAFETYPDLAADGQLDGDSLARQMTLYSSGMQRYLATSGGKWTSLQPQVANPANHLEWYVKLLCATDGIPTKIFLGSESGHLAASKDDEAWRMRCQGRQTRYCEPLILRPLIDRLITFGCLPKVDKYSVNWRDLRSLSDKDRADVALKKMQSLQTFFSADIDQRFPTRFALTMIMGFTEEQADAIEEELKKNPPPEPLATITNPPPPATGGGRNGTAPKGSVGRPSNGAPQGESKSATKPGTAGRRARMMANVRG